MDVVMQAAWTVWQSGLDYPWWIAAGAAAPFVLGFSRSDSTALEGVIWLGWAVLLVSQPILAVTGGEMWSGPWPLTAAGIGWAGLLVVQEVALTVSGRRARYRSHGPAKVSKVGGWRSR